MKVRITKQLPESYGVENPSLEVGGVYELDTWLAMALITDGCAVLWEKASTAPRSSPFEALMEYVRGAGAAWTPQEEVW